jgi:hypothetical protein
MSQKGSIEKTPDSDILREMIVFAAGRLMEVEVGAGNARLQALSTAGIAGDLPRVSRAIRQSRDKRRVYGEPGE